LNDFCLFFDGASNGNSGQAGGGGVILSPDNSFLSSFAWGLGVDSNNKAEAMALWQGLTQAQDRGITSISVFGDSRIIIQAMSLKKYPSHLQLSRILHKISLLSSKFQKIRYFHILRGLNSLADAEANRGVLLSRSTIMVDGRESLCNLS